MYCIRLEMSEQVENTAVKVSSASGCMESSPYDNTPELSLVNTPSPAMLFTALQIVGPDELYTFMYT